jgi:DHA1 family bicyclomycin/chloramphenicol resistance-like MFS transporter
MIGNFAMSRLAIRVGTARMVRIGLAISFVALSAAFAISLSAHWTPLTLFLPLALNAIGNGLTIPGATASALSARPELAGSAAGLMGAVQLGSGALATIVISAAVIVWPQALMAMMWLMLAVALLALRFGR